MATYDAIIVLGSQPDPTTWQFPQQIYDCLDLAQQRLQEGQAPCIIVSGKWSVSIDNKGLKQPFRECDVLADYLEGKGIPKEHILKEGQSKDTISNLYYIKTQLLLPNHRERLLFIVAEFRIRRLRFLCQRILGKGYTIDYETIPSEVSANYNEPLTFQIQKDFLKPMKDGDHEWLADKFYTASIYQYWEKRDKAGRGGRTRTGSTTFGESPLTN